MISRLVLPCQDICVNISDGRRQQSSTFDVAEEDGKSEVDNTIPNGDRMMGFDQYHEPPNELSDQVRTFARMIASLTEEAEAIGWYEQRIAVEKDKEARAIMRNAQIEEFKHFGMDLEFLLRKKPDWRAEMQTILFRDGDIVEDGEEAEKKVD